MTEQSQRKRKSETSSNKFRLQLEIKFNLPELPVKKARFENNEEDWTQDRLLEALDDDIQKVIEERPLTPTKPRDIKPAHLDDEIYTIIQIQEKLSPECESRFTTYNIPQSAIKTDYTYINMHSLSFNAIDLQKPLEDTYIGVIINQKQLTNICLDRVIETYASPWELELTTEHQNSS